MKKYICIMFAVLATSFGFVACDVETDEDAGGTNIEKMAGEWVVSVDAVDDAGNISYTDPYGMGSIKIKTYNTAANDRDSMWIDDNGNFWTFKIKIPVNYNARTFACDTKPYDSKNSGDATITDGKVLENAGKNIHGMPCDSIVFNIKFSDDKNGLTYRLSGTRYAGFTE